MLRRVLLCLVVLPQLLLAAAGAAEQKLPVYRAPEKQPQDYRNVALNPQAAAETEPSSYPHATSNSEWNKKEFAARCAIDGKRDNKDVHGCGSWGPDIRDDLWWKLDFGRPVEIDALVIYIRAAFPHDNYWQQATLEFSDGSKAEIKLEKSAEPQRFPLSKRVVTWLQITHLKQSEPKKWCAFCEVEVYGRDAGAAP